MKRTISDLERLRAQELLVQRATEGLDDAATAELARLESEDILSFDLAAAAVELATLPREAMPSALSDKLLAAALAATAPATVAPAQVSSPTAPAVPAVAATLPVVEAPRLSRQRLSALSPRRRSSNLPWVAAAAGLALAAGAWWWAAGRSASPVLGPPAPAIAREALVANAGDELVLPWQRTGDASAAALGGDVVWSPARQQGFARFVGLAVNEPARHRYQLWIVDQGRDPRFPVDGGLFDIATIGEVVVPIDPRLPVTAPVEFFVTIEAPAGAVVSQRQRVVGRALRTEPSTPPLPPPDR